MDLTITGYSTAMFSTWYFIEELGLLFDCGDGVTAGLLQKSRKVKHCFISHADRDHLTGLPQFMQLNGRDGFPVVRYPKDSGSFPAMRDFLNQFDPHVKGAKWEPLLPGDQIKITKDHVVEAIRNEHVEIEQSITKSLSYKVHAIKRKLKAEFKSLKGTEIAQIKKERGDDAILEVVSTPILGFSGDTPVHDKTRWKDCQTLIHESTFLNLDENNKVEAKGNHHSELREVIEIVADSDVQRLVLGHFSSRYSREMIDDAILLMCKEYQIKIPVYRLLPGRITRDILNTKPVNS